MARMHLTPRFGGVLRDAGDHRATGGAADRGRSSRVCALIIVIALLSAIDLYITLVLLTGGGMAEENPVARMIIGTGSPALLAAWKAATVAPAAVLCFVMRRSFVAETCAWIGAAILGVVMIKWHLYISEMDGIVNALHLLNDGFDHRWVRL